MAAAGPILPPPHALRPFPSPHPSRFPLCSLPGPATQDGEVRAGPAAADPTVPSRHERKRQGVTARPEAEKEVGDGWRRGRLSACGVPTTVEMVRPARRRRRGRTRRRPPPPARAEERQGLAPAAQEEEEEWRRPPADIPFLYPHRQLLPFHSHGLASSNLRRLLLPVGAPFSHPVSPRCAATPVSPRRASLHRPAPPRLTHRPWCYLVPREVVSERDTGRIWRCCR
ncbi:hypothetical protein U9M48_023996 [Paspalum notatum var. saurae]|uniref:Uncharacterized protein n=1 Tax=Paspalum notatum var. saurae TaxID=547442 RepID=A0AAQ3WW79_PASNO